jgi:hypothetical protein
MGLLPFRIATMPRLGLERSPSIEYLMLADPKPDGPTVGFFRGSAIAAAVVDYFGRRYVFAGIATRGRNGKYDAEALGRGERLVEPGLIYRPGTEAR